MTNRHLGRHIQILREELDFNQDDMAAKIKKSKSLVSYIERTGKVNDKTLKDIAKALNVTFESLKLYPLKDSDSNNNELELLRKENLERSKEIDLLKKVIESQEKLIKILEAKS